MTERQEWCLSCGTAVGTRIVSAPGWRTPIWIGLVLALLAVVAIAIAIAQLADDTGRVTDTRAGSATPAPTVAPSVTPTPSAGATATPSATATATPSAAVAPDAVWPAGKSGWTVVLATASSETAAKDKAEQLAADGIQGIGVVDGNDFKGFPATWVVFAGTFDDQAQARDALDGIDAPDAYIRRVQPA
jgi:hypothetical protein